MELIASGQDAPVQLATREQHVAFTFEEVYYSLEPSMGSAAVSGIVKEKMTHY